MRESYRVVETPTGDRHTIEVSSSVDGMTYKVLHNGRSVRRRGYRLTGESAWSNADRLASDLRVELMYGKQVKSY